MTSPARPTTWSWILACVLGASSVLIAVTFYARHATSSALATARHAVDQRVALRAVLEAVLDAETGQRGYLLTQNREYLAPYHAALERIESRLADASRLLDSERPEVIATLRPLIADKLGELARTVDAEARGDREGALALVRAGRGETLMSAIRAQVETTDAELASTMETRRTEAARRDTLTTAIFAAAGILLVAALAIGFVLRRAVRERVRAQAERDAILAELPIAIALVDAKSGAAVYSNPALKRMRQSDAPIAKLSDPQPSWSLARADGEPYDRETHPLARALAGERVVERALIRRTEGPLHVLVSAVPVPLGSAALLALADITALERAQNELRENLGRVDALFDNVPIGLAFVDSELRYIRVNRVLAALGARTPDDYIGRTVPDVFGDVGASFVPTFEAALRGESTLGVESEHVLPASPEPRWYLSDFFPIRAADGEILGVGAASMDITQRKRAEEALGQLNASLEARIAQRTERLTELNGELEAFSYSVSHDLRAPLRAISSYCQILEEEHASRLDADGQDALRRARAAAVKMGRLIDDMLELSRTTRTEIRRQPVDLTALAERAIADLRESAPNPAMTVTIEPGLVVSGDDRLLATVLRNLLGNAWKFSGKAASPHIELRHEQRDGERVFLVSDNGAGFDLHYAGNLFAPFQRLHPQTAYEGTGIGLATVKRVITKHGGRVWVERASVGAGVTIAFTLGEGAS